MTGYRAVPVPVRPIRHDVAGRSSRLGLGASFEQGPGVALRHQGRAVPLEVIV